MVAPKNAFAKAPVTAADDVGFERALAALTPDLRTRARRLARDHVAAEDIVQDTIERALRFRRQYERGTNLRAWAYQVLYSVFVTQYRRARRERVALRSLGGDPCAWTTRETYGAPDRDASLSPATRRTLDALPESFRVVVELVDLDDLTYREAATELGVPLGTVMSRLHRGRLLLASELAEAA